MYISGVDYESIADGEGCRCTIFISGCKHNCPGCHSPTTHDFQNGEEVTPELIRQINEAIAKRPFLSGITLSGGDPFYSARECRKLLESIVIPHDNVWIYSGFSLEEILNNTNTFLLLADCDVLVDGMFIEDQRDISLKFKGSKNQRIIRLSCGNCKRRQNCSGEELCQDFSPEEVK